MIKTRESGKTPLSLVLFSGKRLGFDFAKT